MNIFSSSKKKQCYCAFCKTPRRVSRRRSIGFVHVVGAAMTSLALMMVMWQEPDPRALVIFAFALALSEIFVQMMWRIALRCGLCGFDPILYMKDPQKAAEIVKAHLEARRADPGNLLRPQPRIPTLSPERALAVKEEEKARQAAEARRKKGTLVSRSI